MAVIGKIRNQGWLLIGLMILSLIAFILMDQAGSGGTRVKPSDELVIVDGNALSNTAFNQKLQANISNYKAQTQQTELSDADMNAIRNSTYNQMINESLYKKVFEKNGIVVGDEEFNDMLRGEHIHPGISNSFKDESGNFDPAMFDNFISTLDIENNPTDEPGTKRKQWTNFEKAIVQERLNKKYKTLIEKSLTIPTAMAKANYQGNKAQVNINYVKIPYSSVSEEEVKFSDADLKAYMQKNIAKYEKEASVDIKFVAFPIVASQNDKVKAEQWTAKKMKEWETIESDSLFLNLYSDKPYDLAYYGKDELTSTNKDTLFKAEVGTIFPMQNAGSAFVAEKLLGRKMIADSLQARHLLISLDDVKTQEEAFAKFQLFDSLYNLVDSSNYSLASLTAQFSDDKSNAANGGDLGVVKPNQMVKPFNDMIFFKMKEGDVEKVRTQFGLHIVEVYKSKPTKEAVKVGVLQKDILASAKTQEKTYANASIFAGNHNTKEKFVAAEETNSINNAFGLTKEDNNIQKIQGNAREIIKWAFKAEEGEVSTPFSIGETYYIALLLNKNEKGIPNISDNNRLFVQVDAAKEKKAEIIKAKISGNDLNSIASANNTSVAQANDISFTNTMIAGNAEPKVAGVALATAQGSTSKAIVGEDGVYIIEVSSKTEVPEDANAIESLKQSLNEQAKYSVTSILDEANRKAANIVDNRFDFF